MIIWHYCPQKYIMDANPDAQGQNGPNINFVFGQQQEKEDWKDDEDKVVENEEEYVRGAEIQFWMGHTNFDITKEMVSQFDKYEGVEFCRVLTRYCFIISPGMLFSFADIRKKIESDFCEKLEQDDIIKVLKEKYKFWILYTNGKGEMEYASSNTGKDERFIEDSAYFKLSMKKNGGQILESAE